MSAWDEVLRLISEVEQNAERTQERGLLNGSATDIIQAQMAVGCKRGMAELRRKIQNHIEIEKRIEAAAEAKSRRRDERAAARRDAKLSAQTPQPERTYEPSGNVAEFPKSEGAA